jgi:chromosome segregation ATPase
MQTEQDTTAEVVETEVSDVNSPLETTDSSEAVASETKIDPEVERLQKERDQARMRANQLENEAKQAREAAAEAERKRLEEAGDYKSLAERLQQEKEEREAAEAAKAQEAKQADEAKAQQERIQTLRQEVLDKFPANVQELAKSLDLWWGEASTEADAQAQLETKLKALQATLPGQPEPEIHANNPAGEVDGIPFQELSLEDMRKQLPRAESR